MLFVKDNWRRWGLSCLQEFADRDHTEHDLVASYLERHAEEHADWSENYNYSAVLKKARDEINNGRVQQV